MRTLALALMLATLASAQWIKLPTAGVPRSRGGKPNLAAPAPRAANGKPDLSGIWELEHPPCSPTGCGDDYLAGPEFLNIGAKLTGGLPYLPWSAQLVAKRAADVGRDDPIAFCRPGGAVRMLTYPPPRKILQLPSQLVILSERDVTYRQIFTDGRGLPVDPAPTFNGFSAGKWEGDVLVVQTNGLREGTWLDRRGSPITEQAKMTEKFHRVNYGRLEIELTIDDPGAYTKPWTVKLNQTIVLDTELLDYHCTDNEQDARHIASK